MLTCACRLIDTHTHAPQVRRRLTERAEQELISRVNSSLTWGLDSSMSCWTGLRTLEAFSKILGSC